MSENPYKTPRNDHAIGIFDSGVGGLTVMQQLMRELPNESMVYFGDTARVPYGGKSPETIIRYSIENSIFLLEKKIKLLVVACNTASSVAIEKLERIFNIPVVGTIEPCASKAAAISKNKRFAILGTKATIQSKAYEKAIKKSCPEATVISIACPLFVPLIEESFLHHPSAKGIVKEYLSCLNNQNVDTVLLGCTHYPLLKSLIQEELGKDVVLVDSAATCAETTTEILNHLSLQSSTQTPPLYHYYVSDDPEKFRELSAKLFDLPVPYVEHQNLK